MNFGDQLYTYLYLLYSVMGPRLPPAVQQAIEMAERELGEEGRLVVRYSGTEALARVMVEAASEEQMQRIAAHVSETIERELGASQ